MMSLRARMMLRSLLNVFNTSIQKRLKQLLKPLVLSPGNPSADVAADPNYEKPGLQGNRVYPTGKLVGFHLFHLRNNSVSR